ncbi:MAG: hypothetical protein IPP90_02720 [Gemmatimonadaceae bacterium]|nr:hypothetical protein [Gemmatimonadaceae bacterium]
MLDGAKAQRSELRNQLERLQDTRNDLVRELSSDGTPAAAKQGIEARIAAIDARITATDQQLAKADQAVAEAAAVPGAVVEPPRFVRNGPSEEMVIVPIVMFTLFFLFPLSLAWSRRIWRRSSTVIGAVPQEVRDRLDRMGEAVESIAIEVERIGEGQRFVTKVMSESGRSLGAGAAQPIPVAQAERAGVLRES